jgi:hypothetical protein
MTRSQKERIEAAILANGGIMIKNTSKSDVFTYPLLPDGMFFYVGNNGSLRAGKSKADSIPYNKFKAKFLSEQV